MSREYPQRHAWPRQPLKQCQSRGKDIDQDIDAQPREIGVGIIVDFAAPVIAEHTPAAVGFLNPCRARLGLAVYDVPEPILAGSLIS